MIHQRYRIYPVSYTHLDQPEKETVNANNSSDNIHRRTTGFDPYSYPTFDPTTLPASQVKAQAQQKQQNENFVDHNTNTHSTRKEQNSCLLYTSYQI